MAARNRYAIIVLDHLIVHAEELLAELRAYDLAPASALLAAEQVAADLHDTRRVMLEDMILFPVGEC